ncbi:hypothetical protein [Streptomyces sp. NPDC056144]|uniref:hypothetical protein n=1 Tax=unclassified Streptomyces TaxID=2593676 RepID=UPI0035E3391F
MRYRDTSSRVPLDEKRATQKSVTRDSALQENPPTSNIRNMKSEEGYRPGAFSSETAIHPDIARPDGWRPAGSFSGSSVNEDHPGKMTNAWNRRMVVDDWSDHDYAMGCYTDPTHASRYYRSGRPKLGGAVVQEFGEGVEAGFEEPHGR